MDPLTAFSLAGTVIQIVDFSTKIVGSVREISVAGAKAEFVEIEEQTRILHNLSRRLWAPELDEKSNATHEDRELVDLCEQSEKVSTQLLVLLEKLKPTVGNRVSLQTICLAVKSEWKETEIKKFQERLGNIERRAHLLITVTYNGKILDKLSSLEDTFREFRITRLFRLAHS